MRKRALYRVAIPTRMGPFRLNVAGPRRVSALANQFPVRGAPGLGAALDAGHVRDAALRQKLRGPERPEAALTNHEHRTVARHVVEAVGQVGLGQIDGAGDVSVSKLF